MVLNRDSGTLYGKRIVRSGRAGGRNRLSTRDYQDSWCHLFLSIGVEKSREGEARRWGSARYPWRGKFWSPYHVGTVQGAGTKPGTL